MNYPDNQVGGNPPGASAAASSMIGAPIVVTAPKIKTEQAVARLWDAVVQDIGAIDPATQDWKHQTLPLGRIKKIMKSEEFAMLEYERLRAAEGGEYNEGSLTPLLRPCSKFMIAQEAPVLMTKACELLIQEISVRAWQHTDTHRRKTLQRADIHSAVGENEVFDFLIDIVPRVMPGTAPAGSDASHQT